MPKCDTQREVILADGSLTKMLEWKNAKIALDDYNTIYGDVLLSSSRSYDMLFGLNSCVAINANISQDSLRYCVKIDGKEKFGKLPLIKRNRNNQ